ncbi:hypothetical protein [Streptomyces chilikensis]|uniref:hypothetical protein n=1 Tax=Streptomyces chilikensis TaxID=1194079 RepID=UPI000A6CA877|nr:hypothetical protein [Streptomyces chilikensis]
MPTTPTLPSPDRVTQLLATSDSLLAGGLGDQLTPVGRRRGAAYALRIALELIVARTLEPRNKNLPELSMRAQRLCLRHYVGHALAYRVDALYAQLCRGCKYHHDELGPGDVHIRVWRGEVDALDRELAAAAALAGFPAQAGPERAAAAETADQPSMS